LREQDIKSVLIFLKESCPELREALDCLPPGHARSRQVVENLKIKLYAQGEKLFAKGDRADNAYIMLRGTLGIYDSCKLDDASCTHHQQSPIKKKKSAGPASSVAGQSPEFSSTKKGVESRGSRGRASVSRPGSDLQKQKKTPTSSPSDDGR
jgi:hypothetical protein